MEICGVDLKTLRDAVVEGYPAPRDTVLMLIDNALACEAVHDDEQIENEHASLKFMRSLLIGSLISGVAQYWFFKWLFMSSGWF